MHKLQRHSTFTIALISICLTSAGCTTTRTLPRPHVASEAHTAGIEPGRKVVLTLASGEVRTLRVTAIEPDALVGKDARIAYADIEKVQTKKFSGRRTASVVGGTLVVIIGGLLYWGHQVEKHSD